MSVRFSGPRVAASAAVFILSACTSVSPPYIAPQVTISNSWSSPDAPSERSVINDDSRNENWWLMFRDPQLDQLVRMGLTRNHALKAAQAAAEAANFEAGVARGQLYPRLDASGSAGRVRSGPAKGDMDSVTRLGVQGSFDIDPAGGNRRRHEAALADADAAIADRDRIRSSVIADITLNYIRLTGAHRQLAITQENLDDQNKHLRITNGQRAEGAVSDLEVARARAQTEGTAARIPQLNAQIAAFTSRLGVLTGMQAGPLNSVLQAKVQIPSVPEDIAVSSPVATVRHRPDIRIAERRLARDTALKEAAIAGMYPSLSLSAFYGRSHSGNAGSYSPWDIAASTLAPLIDFGRIRNQINASDARARQSLQSYEESVLNGLADVETNLSAYLNEKKRVALLTSAARHEGDGARIAAAQYEAGTVSQIDLLLAEQNRLQADLALAASQQVAAENLVRLMQAMGWGALASIPVDSDVPAISSGRGSFARMGMRPVVDR